jgi:hypothetical protein
MMRGHRVPDRRRGSDFFERPFGHCVILLFFTGDIPDL